MGELYVDPGSVRRFGEAIDGLAGDTSTGVSYHDQWCTISGGNGIFANFTSISTDVRTSVDTALRHMQSVLDSSAQELDAAADYYTETDDEVAAEMDRTYPG